MAAQEIVFLVEEPSMEEFLRSWLPRSLPAGCPYRIHAHRGKDDLLKKLAARLRAFAAWKGVDRRIIVIVDRDDSRCPELKERLESAAEGAGLTSRRRAGKVRWNFASRIAIEELEAWYFGDWTAVCAAYPRVSATIPDKAPYRDPDAIAGGTWEALERVLKNAGYFKTGLRKMEAARAIGKLVDAGRSRSGSFRCLAAAVEEAVG